MSLKFRRNEKRALIAIVVALVVVGGGWGAWKAVGFFGLESQKSAFDEFQEDNAQTYQQGETVVGDSHADEDMTADGSDNWSYASGFDWDGTMKWTVVDSWLYDDPADAGISADSPGTFLAIPASIAETGDYKFLLCEVRVENVDAMPESKESPHCNIATLHGGGSLGYFDGTFPGATDHESWEYNLDPGTTAVYHVGYYVDNPGDDVDALQATLGNRNTGVPKTTIQLHPHDMRGTKAGSQ